MAKRIKPPYLVTTSTGFCRYRRRVPDILRAEIGKTEIVLSLQTRDPREIPTRYAKTHAEVEDLFQRARRKEGVSSDAAFDMALRSLRAKGLVDPLGSVVHQDRDDVSAAQDIVLSDAGFNNFDELEEAFEGHPRGKAPAKLRAVSAALGILQGGKRPATLSSCLNLFLKDKARNKDQTKRYWKSYERERRRIMAEFVKLVGEKNINEVSRQDARGFLAKLERENYSPESVKKQTAFLGTVTDWALRELELEGKNPFSRLVIAKPIDHSEKRISFEYQEVQFLLSRTETINDDLSDIVRLLACTGARLAEISGLEVRDVLEDGAVIHIRFNNLRRIKNQMSDRQVPVVDKKSIDALLSRIMGRKPTDPVFRRYGRDGGADSASAALSKWLERIGLRDTKAGKSKTTHSLRHTFKDALRDTSASEDVAKMIQGHTAGDAASKYGSSDLIERKRETMEKAWEILNPGQSGSQSRPIEETV